jgi:hypothetical protein
MQIKLSEEDLTIMIHEASRVGSARSNTGGVDLETYCNIMKSCTLF